MGLQLLAIRCISALFYAVLFHSGSVLPLIILFVVGGGIGSAHNPTVMISSILLFAWIVFTIVRFTAWPYECLRDEVA